MGLPLYRLEWCKQGRTLFCGSGLVQQPIAHLTLATRLAWYEDSQPLPPPVAASSRDPDALVTSTSWIPQRGRLEILEIAAAARALSDIGVRASYQVPIHWNVAFYADDRTPVTYEIGHRCLWHRI
jgi:hypothetical protein